MFTVSAFTLLLTSVEAGYAVARLASSGRIPHRWDYRARLRRRALSAISLAALFFYAGTLVVAGTADWCCSADGVRPMSRPPRPCRCAWCGTRSPLSGGMLQQPRSGLDLIRVRSSLIPVLVVELLRPASWTGIAFACAAVAQTIAVGPAGRFTDTVGRRPAMILGGTVAAVSIMAVPFAPNIWLLIVGALSVRHRLSLPGHRAAAAVGDAAGHQSGTAVAVFSMCSDIGAIIGPLVAGLLADTLSYPAAFGVGAALMLVAAGLSWRMPGGQAVPSREGPSKGICMSPRPLTELVSADWAEALQPVAATISAMGAFLRAELAAGRSYLPAGEHVLRAFTAR